MSFAYIAFNLPPYDQVLKLVQDIIRGINHQSYHIVSSFCILLWTFCVVSCCVVLCSMEPRVLPKHCVRGISTALPAESRLSQTSSVLLKLVTRKRPLSVLPVTSFGNRPMMLMTATAAKAGFRHPTDFGKSMPSNTRWDPFVCP